MSQWTWQLEAVRFRVSDKGTMYLGNRVPFRGTLVKSNGILGKVPGSFFKMAASGGKSSVVRDICAFLMLAEDDDNIVLLANEGLKVLARLVSERFGKKHPFCG